ncbi:uncharacterized protein LOC135388133 [Ornithodoros turicata]|uniref:uncharacterized protein LOC135388133 n=1 Tax=Ornithodoros turicata TaxID=34597 RepID=UPI00313A4954
MIAFWYSVTFLACVDFGHVIFVPRRYSCHLGITGATMLMQIALLLACLFTWECVRSQNDQIAWNALQRDKGFFLMKRSVFYKDENKCVYLIKRRIISKRQKIEAHYGFWNGDHYSEEPCVMQAPPGGNGTVVYVSSPILGGKCLPSTSSISIRCLDAWFWWESTGRFLDVSYLCHFLFVRFLCAIS